MAVIRYGKTLVSGGFDRAIHFWDLQKEKPFHSILDLDSQVQSISINPNGAILGYTTFYDKVIHLVGMTNGKKISQLKGHKISGISMAFSSNGKMVVSGGMGKTVRLWEVATGLQRATFIGHHGHIRCVAFSPDMKSVVTGSYDGSAIVWDVTCEAIKKIPKKLTPQELEKVYRDLGSEDSISANRSIWKMVSAATQSVPFLSIRLKPAPPLDTKKMAMLLKDLDNKNYSLRKKAEAEIDQLCEVGHLQKILTKDLSVEARMRISNLIKKKSTPPSGELLHGLRSLEVLELAGTKQAWKIIANLAKGDPEARLTQEAIESLERRLN